MHIFPEFLFPPSEINGIPYFLQTGATSNNALNWGIPEPATTRVIQIDPLPIPQRIPSAPALINNSAASPVATLPYKKIIFFYNKFFTATISIFGKRCLRVLTASIQSFEWPFATSTTKTSTPASINFSD